MNIREEFESSFTQMMIKERNASQSDIDQMLRRIGDHQEYGNRFTAAAWWAWQASRSAIEIRIPNIRDFLDTWGQKENRSDYEIELRDSIESLGLKVAP